MTGPAAMSPSVQVAFAPLHKRAFGVACGVVSALGIFLLTAVYLIRQPEPGFDLGLLGQYFAGYSVSWRGAVIGAAWAGFVGFVMGWFVAFARNFLLTLLLFAVRTRAELADTKGFLDHI